MQSRTRLVCALMLSVVAIPGAAEAQARTVTLSEALRLAAQSHPLTRLAEADGGIARGELLSARLLPNPVATGTLGPATTRDTSLVTGQFALSQTIELGGKRATRTRGATLRLEATSARIRRQRDMVAFDVRRTFALAIIASERVATALDADSVGQALLRAAEDRLRLGAGTQLELNVAAAAAARDRRARVVAQQTLTRTLSDLQAAIGLPPSDAVIPVGRVTPGEVPMLSEDSLVHVAISSRPDLSALRYERDAAVQSQRLAQALRWPDPSIGLSAGRAEDFRVRVLTLAIPLPLWNRGAGERASAAAALERSNIALLAAEQSAEREVRVAWRALQGARESANAFDEQVVSRLRENLELANESFRSGKISFFAYSTLRRDLVAARLDYLEALGDIAERSFALAAATGLSIGGLP